MNALKGAAILLFLIFVMRVGIAQNPATENQPKNMLRLLSGLANNNESTFKEVAALPIDQAAPLLLPYVNDASTNLERAQRARNILREIPGFSEYMKQRLLEKRSRPAGEYQMQEFRMLEAIGGDESAAAVAPFLFVEDKAVVLSNDFSAGPIKYDALHALVKMHLADAPNDKEYSGYKSPDIEAWKAWAIKKGYKDNSIPPLITLKEKGVPYNVIVRSERILAGLPSPASSTPVLPPNENPMQPKAPTGFPDATAPPAAEKVGPSRPRLLALASLAIVIAGATIFLIIRKR